MHGLHAIFHGNTCALGKFLEQIQDIVGHAVGPSADGESDDERMFEGSRVQSAELVDGSVGIRGGLKISLEMLAVVATLESSNALVDLLENILTRQPATGTEAAIVTEGATSRRHGAVHIRAGEAAIHAHLLHTHSEERTQVMVISMVAQAGLSPGWNR